jgi:hypothetical protein
MKYAFRGSVAHISSYGCLRTGFVFSSRVNGPSVGNKRLTLNLEARERELNLEARERVVCVCVCVCVCARAGVCVNLCACVYV